MQLKVIPVENKVLMMATYFPPAGGISTFRITKFVKFLPSNNWEPVVITVDESHYKEYDFLIDESLSKDISQDLKIYRSTFGKRPMFLKSIRNALPTRWLESLIRSIGGIIKKEVPDLLYITGDPFFPLLIAPFVKIRYGLKYVIDLRDPWKLAIPDVPPKGLKSRLFTFLNNISEPLVVNRASKIIVVSEKMKQDYQAAYPHKKEDFIVLPNGYDPDDYDNIDPIQEDTYTIVYAGKFLAGESFRNPVYFFRALALLKKNGLKIKFKYIGARDEIIERMAKEEDIYEDCISTGYLSYSNTIAHMRGADLLILIGNGQKTEQTGKIFDYLGCKRPILALASKEGGIADVVVGVDNVELHNNENPELIADVIEKLYLSNPNGFLERKNIDRFKRDYLTKQLAIIFENAK